MSFQASDIVDVQEIIALSSYQATETLVSNLNAAQETAIRAEIVLFKKVRNSFADLKGELNTNNDGKRLAIRNRVRNALGLPWLTSENDLATTGGAGSGEICYSHPAAYGECENG